MSEKHQKGITLYLVIVILAVVLAVAIGLSTILVSQIKMITGMGNSVKALYAADTGIERVLKDYYDGSLVDHYPETSLDNNSRYEVKVFCCYYLDEECVWTESEEGICPLDNIADEGECQATEYCIRSVGSYEDVKRAIEVEVTPVE